MKKLLFFTAIVVTIVSVISCTKEQTGSSGTTIKAITGEATDITNSSVYISGQAFLGETIPADTKFGVLYSTSSGVLYGSATEVEATDFSSDYKYNLLISGLNPKTTYYYRSFIYQNGVVTYGEVKDFTTLAYSTPESVDLGLSVKWASFNIGATKPEEYGIYFAWGDVTGQTWNGSSWSGGGFYTYPAYELDENNNLKPEYDAAHINLGGSWRMPTKVEWQELKDNCTTTWTSDYNGTGVAGRIFTSNKEGYTDKSIFLPATGRGDYSSLYNGADSATYWLSTFRYDDQAWILFFIYVDNAYVTGSSRCNCGYPVRPVTE